MLIKAIIADDEIPAQDELCYLLKETGGVEIVGQAQNAEEILQLAKTVDYNTLFLDIQMPGLNGIDAAARLQEISDYSPCIVFVTAYDEYAVRAFKVNAVDYILKPIDLSKLNKTLGKIKNQIKMNKIETGDKSENEVLKRVVVKRDNRLVLVNVEDIYFVCAEDGDVFLTTYDEKFLVPATLKEMEKKLPSQMFFRTHRGCLVNMNHVKEISPFFSGTYIMYLNDRAGSEIQVSRKQTKKLKQLLSI